MFNIFKKKIAPSEFNYIDDIISKINATVNYVYSSNDLSGNSEYENLKKESKSYQKQFIIDSVNYIAEILNKEFENQQKSIKKRDNNIYRYRLTAFAILNGLMRRNLDYSEKEWISGIQTRQYSRKFPKKIRQRLTTSSSRFFSDFMLGAHRTVPIASR